MWTHQQFGKTDPLGSSTTTSITIRHENNDIRNRYKIFFDKRVQQKQIIYERVTLIGWLLISLPVVVGGCYRIIQITLLTTSLSQWFATISYFLIAICVAIGISLITVVPTDEFNFNVFKHRCSDLEYRGVVLFMG